MNFKITSFVLSFILTLVSILVLILRLVYPYHRIIAVLIYLISWIPFVYSFLKFDRSKTLLKKGTSSLEIVKKYSSFLILFLFLILTSFILFVLFPVNDTTFVSIGEQELTNRINDDFMLLSVSLSGIEQAYQDIEHQKNLFEKDFSLLTYIEKEQILQLWSTYLDYFYSLDALKQVHSHFFQINYLKHPQLYLRSFLIAYTSFVTTYKSALLLTSIVDEHLFLETFLNEDHEALGIPKDSYFWIQQGITNPEYLLQLNAGQANLWFLKAISQLDLEEIKYLDLSTNNFNKVYTLLGRNPRIFLLNPVKYFEKNTFSTWFPLQKEIAITSSITRATSRENFITDKQINIAKKILIPGDILLERRNWYASNIGLPGFWPHSALYTGTLEDMDVYFNDVSFLKGELFSMYLEQHFAEVYEFYLQQETSVIESVKEGVILSRFEESGKADYLGVLRPRISKEEKLYALLEAFNNYGKPYDFNFDFVTQNSFVCSELLFYAYLPKEHYKGIHFPLRIISGRLLLTPNDMVQKFDEEYPNSELDFVLFLDGSENLQTAHFENLDVFRKTWKRSKWDFYQD